MFYIMLFVKTAAAAAVIFLVLDHLWFTLFAGKIYFKHLSFLSDTAKEKIVYKKVPIILSRVVISMAITAAIFMSIIIGGKISWAVAGGGITGFALYSAYNLTALSFIKKWSPFITALDISWGTLQGMLAGIYVFFITGFL